MSEQDVRAEQRDRKDARRKQREELRNAMRFAIAEQGLTTDQISATLIALAKDRVDSVMSGTAIEAIIRKVVREEMKALLESGYGQTTMKSMLTGFVREEAQKYAKEFIEKNILITLTPGGTF